MKAMEASGLIPRVFTAFDTKATVYLLY